MNLVGIERQNPSSPEHKFQYNGKEKQTKLGLNWMDYGARMYDAQIGRWHVVDPLADLLSGVSPYNYVLNNPISLTDPTGMFPFDEKDADKDMLNKTGASVRKEGRDPRRGMSGQGGGNKDTKNSVRGTGNNNTIGEVSVTAAPLGPEWGNQVINHWRSGNAFSTNPDVPSNGYSYTRNEINAGLSGLVTLATLPLGGVAVGIRALMKGAVLRGTTDIGIQLSANLLLNGGNSKGIFSNVNLVETGLATLGANAFTLATGSATFQYSTGSGYQSTFNGGVSSSDFLYQSAVGSVFGYTGGRVGAALSSPSVTLGTYMGSSIRFGQIIGVGASKGLAPTATFGIGVAEEYIENK
jgi:RHS repeat-associated protein